jgi:hypothetical protein
VSFFAETAPRPSSITVVVVSAIVVFVSAAAVASAVLEALDYPLALVQRAERVR